MSNKYHHLDNSKAILHSKRANIFFLEHCRVVQKDGRITYITERKNACDYWNIPIANTTFMLLGPGTSISQAAMRLLSSAGVMVGFTGGGGTPLFSATEVEWLNPQSEYRPTEYLQQWVSFWFDEAKRLEAARRIQRHRLAYLAKVWSKNKLFQDHGLYIEDIHSATDKFEKSIERADDVNDLLCSEGRFAKDLYKYVAQKMDYPEFQREQRAGDTFNNFLDNGNYLAYGLGACALWTLGLPFGLAVLHGKTRRGGLVFDAADLIKDTLIIPNAFIAASQGKTNSEFRQDCIKQFQKYKSLDYIFETLKTIAQKGSEQC